MSETSEAVVLPAHMSARTLLGRTSLIILAILAAVLITVIIFWPHDIPPLITGSIALLYLCSTIDRNYLVLRGLKSSALIRVSDDEARMLTDGELPVYTVLLPVYDEPAIVSNLINGVGKLDYPSDKLEILLLVEEDDIATQNALSMRTCVPCGSSWCPTACPRRSPRRATTVCLCPICGASW